jgi:hypothetical protein
MLTNINETLNISPVKITFSIALSTLIGILAYVGYLKMRKKPLKDLPHNQIRFMAALIFIIGTGLRIATLKSFDTSLNGDEARTYLTVRKSTLTKMLATRKYLLPDNALLGLVIQNLYMKVRGPSIFNYMLPGTVYSTFSLVGVYMLAKKFLPKTTALVVLAWMALNYIEILYAASGRPYALITLLVPLNGIAFINAIERPKKYSWLLYLISLLLCIYTHHILISLFLIHSTYIIFLGVQNWTENKTVVKNFIRSISIAVLLATPSFVSFVPKLIQYDEEYPISSTLKNPENTYKEFVKQSSPLFLGLGPILLMALYGYVTAGKIKRGEYRYLLLFIYLLLGVSFSYIATARLFFLYRYTQYLLPFALIAIIQVIDIGWESINQWLFKNSMGKEQKSYLRIISLVLISLLYWGRTTIPKQYQRNIDGDWKSAAAYLEKYYQQDDHIISFTYLVDNMAVFTDLPFFLGIPENHTLETDKRLRENIENRREITEINWSIVTVETLSDLATGARIWLVQPTEIMDTKLTESASGYTAKLSEHGYVRTHIENLYKLQLELYEKETVI